jgi:ParB-like chromosome segregation protein Spo0J
MTRPTLKNGTVTLTADAVIQYERVPIHAISLPDNHCGMDFHQVEVYAALLRSGVRLEPVLLYRDADRCWLIDGRHRYVANLVAGMNEIEAFVTDGLNMVA